MSIGFTCTINPADQKATQETSARGIAICYLISDIIAKNHDMPSARLNWFVTLRAREKGTVSLTAYFYKRKLEEDLPDDDEIIVKKINEWVHTVNENPDKWKRMHS